MRLLLDTHVFLWWVEGSAELSRRATRAIGDSKNECFVSVASCWEMAVKASLGKLKLDAPLESFVPEQMAANRFSTAANRLPSRRQCGGSSLAPS